MSKSTKMIAALGIVAGLGIAALPLGAVSATGECTPNDAVAAPTTAEGTPPRCTSQTVTLNVTDGVSISLSNASVSAWIVAGGNTVTAQTSDSVNTEVTTTVNASGSLAYDVTATTPPLAGTNGNDEEIEYQAPAKGSDGWQMYYLNSGASGNPTAIVANSPISGLSGAAAGSTTGTISYGFSAATTTPTDAYTGTTVFTIAAHV